MTNIIDRLKTLEKGPRWHGNGFVQLYLQNHRRLHVWHPDLSKFDNHNAQRHNHRYDVISNVLHGRLTHTTYHLTHSRQNNESELCDRYEVQGSGELTWAESVYATITGGYDMVAGSTYSFLTPWFHTSDAKELTVTVFDIGVSKLKVPSVLAPIGEVPIDAFDPSRSPPVEALWSAINDAVNAGDVAGKVERLFPELF